MSLDQNVALVMLNRFVKFNENSLKFGRHMLKISKIYEIAIYGKVTTPPSGRVFLTKSNSFKEFERQSIEKYFCEIKNEIQQPVSEKKIF